MRVAVYYNNSDVRTEEMAEPEIGQGEVKVKVKAGGICGSDVMEWYRIKTAPKILGHEITGELVDVGAKVKGYKVGERVFVSHHVPCNTCNYCLKGYHTACDTLHTTNFYPGGFVEYLRVPEINVDRGIFVLPDEVSYETGTFIEPLGCVVRGYKVCDVKPGERVMIIGAGISGLLFVKLAKALGAGEITTVDLSSYRLDAAARFGADRTINGADFKGEHNMADKIIICTGAPAAVQMAINSVDRGGKVLFFAVDKPGVDIAVPINQLWRNSVTLQTTYGAAPDDLQMAIDLLKNKRIDVDDMITHKFGLGDASAAFKLVADAKDSMKVILEPEK